MSDMSHMALGKQKGSEIVTDILPNTTYNQCIICFLFLLLAVISSLVQPVVNTIKGFFVKEVDLIINDKYVLMELMPKVSIRIRKRVTHLHL